MDSELAPETRDFLTRHIVSVEQLEVLLLLHEKNDAEWSAAEINRLLRSQETSIRRWLVALVGAGLARQQGDLFRFAPATKVDARQIDLLAHAYRERRIKIIELIFSKPNENLLNFVRAFDLRKRP